MTTDMTVATTILQQLGGRRFQVFTGAKNFVGTENSLTFRMPKAGRDQSNVWQITLTPMDVYRVETFSVRGGTRTPKSTFEDIYCDQLVELFERVSGFYTKF